MILVLIFLFLIYLGIILAISMACTALMVGVYNSWFMLGNFSDGWHMAWQKPWLLFAFALVIGTPTILKGAVRFFVD